MLLTFITNLVKRLGKIIILNQNTFRNGKWQNAPIERRYCIRHTGDSRSDKKRGKEKGSNNRGKRVGLVPLVGLTNQTLCLMFQFSRARGPFWRGYLHMKIHLFMGAHETTKRAIVLDCEGVRVVRPSVHIQQEKWYEHETCVVIV